MLVLAGHQEPDSQARKHAPEVAAHAVRKSLRGKEGCDARERNHLRGIAQRAPILLEQRERVSLRHRPFAGR